MPFTNTKRAILYAFKVRNINFPKSSYFLRQIGFVTNFIS